jgi:hypothetical protein
MYEIAEKDLTPEVFDLLYEKKQYKVLYGESQLSDDEKVAVLKYILNKVPDITGYVWFKNFIQKVTMKKLCAELDITMDELRLQFRKFTTYCDFPDIKIALREGVDAVNKYNLEIAHKRENILQLYEIANGRLSISEMTPGNEKYWCDIQVIQLNLSTRAKNALIHNGVNTIADLLKLDKQSVKSFRNVGTQTAIEIEQLKNRCTK